MRKLINFKFYFVFYFQVHIKSHFIMNGVCVRFRGWIDIERLDGVGCLEYDERRALHEDAILREQIDRYNQRLRDFKERHDEVDHRRGVPSGMGVGVGVGGGGGGIATGMWRR